MFLLDYDSHSTHFAEIKKKEEKKFLCNKTLEPLKSYLM